MSTKAKLTMTNGCPVADNQNVLTAGQRGPMLLQDVWFLEKLAHFDREVIPERRMHAKGSGAYGSANNWDWDVEGMHRMTAAYSMMPSFVRRNILFYSGTVSA